MGRRAISSANARDSASTWSSCVPNGKLRNSDTSAAFQSPRSINTLPTFTCAANGSARVTLSPVSGLLVTR